MAIGYNARSILVFLSVISSTFGVCRPDATAQSTTIKPGDELRPLFATPQDIAEGQQLAQASCAGCHGPGGMTRC